jgi:hypothetical protein
MMGGRQSKELVKMWHIPLATIRQSVGLQARVTTHLAQHRLLVLKVHLTMMGELVHHQSHPVAVGQVLRMIETILWPEIELSMSVVMCLGHLLIHLGLRRPPGYLPRLMVAEVTTAEEAVATPETIGHIIIICLLPPRAVAKIVSHFSQRM